MACEEMREWEEVREEVEELIKLELPGTPPADEIVEEIHEESHKLIDLQKMLDGRPNLKKVEVARLLKQASVNVLTRLRKRLTVHSPLLAVQALSRQNLSR